jgi:NAD(P)-dependent dehydrogenase (short-subunit alcohol dehydrogenase family)
MPVDLSARTAIVTGAGQGLGRGIALVLAKRGANVVLTGRTESKLISVAAEIAAGGDTAVPVAGDVSSRQDVQRVVEAALEVFGGIDILINNAQSSRPGPVTSMTDEDLEHTLRSGAFGTLYAMQACYPHMKARGGGSIVNFGSSTSITGDRGFGAYAMTKEAIRGLTRVAASEWGRDNIRVNVVCPAAMSPSAAAFRDEDPDRWARILRSIPLGRMGEEVDDIGRAVAALVSDDLRFLTGATLLLDGGRLLVA